MSKDIFPEKSFRLLRSFCPPHLLEEIEGDLLQKYERDLNPSDRSKQSNGYWRRRAKLRLLWNMMRYFRPGILMRNEFAIKLKFNLMLRNHLKMAVRTALRNKSFTTINIAGLVIGLTSAAFLLLWVQNELSFDRFHYDSDRLYEAWNKDFFDGEVRSWSMTPKILAPTLKEEYPQIEEAISFANREIEFLFTYKNNRFTANKAGVTESAFWKLFNFPLLEGDAKTALKDPFSIVLTEKFARRLFNNGKSLGEHITLKYDTLEVNFLVTGILKDLPNNTAFDFDYLLSWELFRAMGEEDKYWGNNSVMTFLKLKPNVFSSDVNEKIRDITKRHSSGTMKTEVFLYPVDQLRLYSKFENGVPVGGRIDIVRLFEIVAFFLLLISCINFMNLSTAKSEQRAKEVGIRKTVGAFKWSLISQYLIESLLLAFVAGLISILCVELFLPAFNNLTDKTLQIDFRNVNYWLAVLSLMIFVGFLAGTYPAFFLSSFRPIKVLKGNYVPSSGVNIRRILVVFQFSFSVVLIFATLVVREQINFAQQREAGFSKNGLVYHPMNADIRKNYLAYQNELISSGLAVATSKTFSPITEQWANTWGVDWQGKDHQSKILFDRFSVDDRFTATTGVQITLGRDFDLAKYPSDSSGVLINESAAQVMGFKNPIGEEIKTDNDRWHIIGVFKDYITRSPFQSTSPMIIEGAKSNFGFSYVHIKLNSQLQVNDALIKLEGTFKKYSPDYPFDYHFVDAEYEKKFGEVTRTKTLASVFGGISIFISCLGILGLSVHMAQKRIKEIGMRKVFGATLAQMMILLSKEPAKLVLLAFLIASPIAYLTMGVWLDNYEYKVAIGWQVFALTGSGLFLITLATICAQIIKSALTNPVNCLRHE